MKYKLTFMGKFNPDGTPIMIVQEAESVNASPEIPGSLPVVDAVVTGSAYRSAWSEQEKQWEKLREWKNKVSPNSKLPKRTHLMDFAAGWIAAIRSANESVHIGPNNAHEPRA